MRPRLAERGRALGSRVADGLHLAPRAAMVFRPAMLRDLDRAACLTGARAIWSQWDAHTGPRSPASWDWT